MARIEVEAFTAGSRRNFAGRSTKARSTPGLRDLLFSLGKIGAPRYPTAASPARSDIPRRRSGTQTVSAMYNQPLREGNWASTVVWGRTRSLEDSAKENSYLFESTINFREKNYAWVRLENAGRSNELLTGEHSLPGGFKEEPLTHVQAYTFGYDRAIDLLPHVSSAVGAQVTAYGVGQPLQSTYGSDPAGV